MICRFLCPIGKSHSLPLRHLIHDHCLFVNAFVSLGCSRIPFTFTFPPASLACFHVWWCVFHLLLCTRPQDLLSKPRTSPEHQLWFMALKSHFYADVSEISIFIPDPLSWRVFTWVSENSETQHVWSPQYFLPNCYTQLPLSQLVAPPVFPVAQARSLGVIFRLLLHTLQEVLLVLCWNNQGPSCSPSSLLLKTYNHTS